MTRLSITLTDEQNERIEELVESGEYSSKNAVVQEWLTRAEKVTQLESAVERLRREKRLILEQREEHGELIEYVEREKTLQERRAEQQERREARQNAPVWKRGYWWVFGRGEQDALANEQ